MESRRNRKTLVLDRTDTIGLPTPARYRDGVERTVRAHGLGRAVVVPKSGVALGRQHGRREVMRSPVEDPRPAACECVSTCEDDASDELPAMLSDPIRNHPETGFALAIRDGSLHALLRTGTSTVALGRETISA